MRHNRDRRKLNRTASHRKAMLRNMVTSLFDRERIRTSRAKAKEARRLAERMITFARRGDLSARRHAARVVKDPVVLKKLFEEIGPRYVDRPGGYTRILGLGFRQGDAANMVILELIGEGEEKRKKKGYRKKERKIEVPSAPEREIEEGKEEAEASEEEPEKEKSEEEAEKVKAEKGKEQESKKGDKKKPAKKKKSAKKKKATKKKKVSEKKKSAEKKKPAEKEEAAEKKKPAEKEKAVEKEKESASKPVEGGDEDSSGSSGDVGKTEQEGKKKDSSKPESGKDTEEQPGNDEEEKE
jgi:large subunit ribosomal protein L17